MVTDGIHVSMVTHGIHVSMVTAGIHVSMVTDAIHFSMVTEGIHVSMDSHLSSVTRSCTELKHQEKISSYLLVSPKYLLSGSTGHEISL